MIHYSITEAKRRVVSLVRDVAQGREVSLTRRGKEVLYLPPCEALSVTHSGNMTKAREHAKSLILEARKQRGGESARAALDAVRSRRG